MMFGSELEAGLSDQAVIVAYAHCIRCAVMMQFDPETVPSVWVHTETRCSFRPDGTQVKPGDPDAVREPLCTPCAHLHQRAQNRPLPIVELFPAARYDLIDLDNARRIQACGAA